MKRLIATLLSFAVTWPSLGQSVPEFMRPATSHELEVNAGVSASMTQGFGPFITVVRVHPTENTWFVIGATSSTAISPGATSALTAASFLPADTTEFFRVNPGGFIAVIADGTAGVIYITEMTK